MAEQDTVVLIKPDAVFQGWVTEIEKRYCTTGLRIAKRAGQQFDIDNAKEFYEEHDGKSFFAGLVLAMISGPSIALLIKGENAIERVRELNGATDPREAKPGTIRCDFRSAGGPFNTVHGSDSPEAAGREARLIDWD